MSLLSDTDIRELQDKGVLGIDPFAAEFVQPGSYDLTVGEVVGKSGEKKELVVKGKKTNPRHYSIDPGEAIIVLTREHLVLPKDLAGLVHLRNSEALRGLYLMNPGHIDPGWGSDQLNKPLGLQLTAILHNVSNGTIELREGEPLMTMVFEKLTQQSSVAFTLSGGEEERKKDLLGKAKKLEGFLDTQKQIQDELKEKLSYKDIMNDLMLLTAVIGLILSVFIGFVATVVPATTTSSPYVIDGIQVSPQILLFLFAVVLVIMMAIVALTRR